MRKSCATHGISGKQFWAKGWDGDALSRNAHTHTRAHGHSGIRSVLPGSIFSRFPLLDCSKFCCFFHTNTHMDTRTDRQTHTHRNTQLDSILFLSAQAKHLRVLCGMNLFCFPEFSECGQREGCTETVVFCKTVVDSLLVRLSLSFDDFFLN